MWSCIKRELVAVARPGAIMIIDKVYYSNHIYRISISIMLIVFSINVSAQGSEGDNSGFSVTLSAGLFSSPYYLGSDAMQTSAPVNVALSYGDRFNASLRDLEFVAVSTSSWQLGPVLKYDGGRDEIAEGNPFTISGNAPYDLIGLGDIDGTVELGGFVEYKARSISAKVELLQGLDGGHKGLKGEGSISYQRSIKSAGSTIFVSFEPTVTFGNSKYNSTFFDVSISQSNASGISEFDANGSISSIGLRTLAIMPISRQVSLMGVAQYDQLLGDVEKSSIVSERGSADQYTMGVFVNYKVK